MLPAAPVTATRIGVLEAMVKAYLVTDRPRCEAEKSETQLALR
jgi:hypothetical protein